MRNGLNRLRARVPKNVRMHHPINPSVSMSSIMHWVAKGSVDDVKKEASKFNNNHVHFDEWIWELFEKTLSEAVAGCTGEISYKDLLEGGYLELDSSPGEPWKQAFATKRIMIDTLGVDSIVEMMESLEASLASGKTWVDWLWNVFSKLDKYTTAKLSSDRLRTIQGGDFFLQLLLMKYLHKMLKAVYAKFPTLFVGKNQQDFLREVSLGFEHCYTVGYDATGMDRTVPANFMTRVLASLFERTSCPDKVFLSVVAGAVFGQLHMPDGELLERVGGNPSGILLTTFFNCMFSWFLKHQVYSITFGEGYTDRVQWLICGDDSVDGYKTLDDAMRYSDVVNHLNAHYSMAWKVDLFEGDQGKQPYPPGLHAPFLSVVTAEAQHDNKRMLIALPAEPRRNLGFFYTQPLQTTFEKRFASLAGIRESLMPFKVQEALTGRAPPQPVQDFFNEFDRFRSLGSRLGRPLMQVHTVESYAHVCTLPC